ncbi:hypothetical protein AMAG_19906 [Allomyces macrogynus ATCC 38327]|uniref:Uncharacterized protein n=1 Tax=Allomyces macrogynus (strain ATCC 38327) TaxID=578462 RepID=A0A0L0T385_ALLM3|nr:hypothetical protein AMAG_19906 [Allomyces macrogynus ATCC 38327]|eukprot:KNE69313.1 hypothetical protein AMAG_19906 [Allomyces macrogynus ATCC 38327]
MKVADMGAHAHAPLYVRAARTCARTRRRNWRRTSGPAARADRNVALGEVLADMRRKITRSLAEITEQTIANASAASPAFAAFVGGTGNGQHAGQAVPAVRAAGMGVTSQVPPSAYMFQTQRLQQQQPPQPAVTAQQYQQAPPPPPQPQYQNLQQPQHAHQQQQAALSAAAAASTGFYQTTPFTPAAAYTAARAKANATGTPAQGVRQSPGSTIQSPAVPAAAAKPAVAPPANGRGRGRPKKQVATPAAAPPANGSAAPKPPSAPQSRTLTTATAPESAVAAAVPLPSTTVLPAPPTSPHQPTTNSPGAREVADIRSPSLVPMPGRADEPMDIVPLPSTTVLPAPSTSPHQPTTNPPGAREVVDIRSPSPVPMPGRADEPMNIVPPSPPAARARAEDDAEMTEDEDHSERVGAAGASTNGATAGAVHGGHASPAKSKSPVARGGPSPVDRPAPAPATPRPATLDVPHVSPTASVSNGGGNTTPRARSADGDTDVGSTSHATATSAKISLQEQALASLSVEGENEAVTSDPIVEEPEDDVPPAAVPASPMKGGPIVVEVAFETVADAHAVGIVVEPVEVVTVAEFELGSPQRRP